MAAALLIIVDAVGRRNPPPLIRYWPAVQGCHDEAGQILCGVWGLPKELRQSVARHHDPREGGGKNGVNPLGAVVSLADHFANLHGRTLVIDGAADGSRIDRTDPRYLGSARDGLGISRAALRSAYDETSALIELLD